MSWLASRLRICWYLEKITPDDNLTSRASPDSVEGGNDHVSSVNIPGKGGVGVQDVFPLRPLGLVMDHLPNKHRNALFRNHRHLHEGQPAGRRRRCAAWALGERRLCVGQELPL